MERIWKGLELNSRKDEIIGVKKKEKGKRERQ